MPARVAFFSAGSEVSPPASSARSRPAVTSSQRQTTVSFGRVAAHGGAGGTPATARPEMPARAPARRGRRDRPALRRPRSRAAARPGEPAARHGHPRTAERRAVADGEHAGRWPCGRRHRSRSPDGPARHRRSDAGCQARAPGPSSGWNPRFSATTSTSNVRSPCRDTPSWSVAMRARSGTRIVPTSCAGDQRVVDHNTGTPARRQRGQHRHPVAQQIGGVARHRRQQFAPRGEAGARRGLHHRDRLHAAGQQFAGQLQVQRTVPAISTRSPGQTRCARTSVCKRAGGHHAGQRPAGQRRRRLMRARRQDQAPGSEGDRPPAHQRGDLVGREGAPDDGVGLDPHAGPLRAVGAGRGQCGTARPARRPQWLSASGLAYWPPGAARSSSSTTAAPASAAAMAADRPAGPPPTTSTSGLASSAASPVGRRFERTPASAGSAPVTRMPSATLVRQARWPMRPSTRDDAVEAGAHAAIQPARRAGCGAAEGDDAGGRQRGGDGLALQRRDRLAVELDCHRAGRWAGWSCG